VSSGANSKASSELAGWLLELRKVGGAILESTTHVPARIGTSRAGDLGADLAPKPSTTRARYVSEPAPANSSASVVPVMTSVVPAPVATPAPTPVAASEVPPEAPKETDTTETVASKPGRRFVTCYFGSPDDPIKVISGGCKEVHVEQSTKGGDHTTTIKVR
jgi:hypothetical protein